MYSMIIVEGFQDIGDKLGWFCAPDSWNPAVGKREGCDGCWKVVGGCLQVTPAAKKDFWRKTYYRPTLCKDDGCFLYHTLPTSEFYTVSTEFTLKATCQFDQAGICIRFSPEHWIKTGIEVVDRKPRLSCVVTNIYSDWSTSPFSGSHGSREQNLEEVVVRAEIRVHCRGNDFVIEAKQNREADWDFIRIAHVSPSLTYADGTLSSTSSLQGPAPMPGQFWAGIFACCPEDQRGGVATFEKFMILSDSDFDHNADGNRE